MLLKMSLVEHLIKRKTILMVAIFAAGEISITIQNINKLFTY